MGGDRHEVFAPANSSTFVQTNKTFSLTYGLGRAQGIVVQDTVKMGGFELSNMPFGVATEVDEQFQRQANDGIMGQLFDLVPPRPFGSGECCMTVADTIQASLHRRYPSTPLELSLRILLLPRPSLLLISRSTCPAEGMSNLASPG